MSVCKRLSISLTTDLENASAGNLLPNLPPFPALHLLDFLPLSTQSTEGSFFQRRTDAAADTFIEVSRPVTSGKTGTAGDRWSPLRVEIGSDKTVAIRTTGNCADLVQKFCRTLAFPLRGMCRTPATDEVKFKSVRRSRTPQLFIIHCSLFIRRHSLRCTHGKRSLMVSANVPNRDTAINV